jgi:hypothetical protein
MARVTNLLNRVQRVSGRILNDSRWRNFYLQRYVSVPALRRFVSGRIAKDLPQPASGARDPAAAARVDEIKRNGVTVYRDGAAPQAVTELREWLQTQLCVDPDRPGDPGFLWNDGAGKDCVHAYYPIETLMRAPHLLGLANTPQVLGIVQRVFGCAPTISEINCWWLNHDLDVDLAKVRHGYYVERQKSYHRDIDDWSVLRYFVYLTDVDQAHGPHSYIPGTHNRYMRQHRNMDFDENPNGLYDTRIDITGPAGTAILMDPFGLHRATVPTAGDRLMLAVTYSLGCATVHAPKKPLLASTGLGIDPFVNRLYVGAPS